MSSAVHSHAAASPSRSAATAPRLSTAPFGRPVVPDVYITSAGAASGSPVTEPLSDPLAAGPASSSMRGNVTSGQSGAPSTAVAPNRAGCAHAPSARRRRRPARRPHPTADRRRWRRRCRASGWPRRRPSRVRSTGRRQLLRATPGRTTTWPRQPTRTASAASPCAPSRAGRRESTMIDQIRSDRGGCWPMRRVDHLRQRRAERCSCPGGPRAATMAGCTCEPPARSRPADRDRTGRDD